MKARERPSRDPGADLQAKYDLERERERLGSRLAAEVKARPAPAIPRVETRDQAIDALRAHSDAIRQLGVARLALFGSFARDEASAESDVDILSADPG